MTPTISILEEIQMSKTWYCLDRLSNIIYHLIRLYNLRVSSSKRLVRNFDQSIFLIVNDTNPTLTYFALYLFESLL